MPDVYFPGAIGMNECIVFDVDVHVQLEALTSLPRFLLEQDPCRSEQM